MNHIIAGPGARQADGGTGDDLVSGLSRRAQRNLARIARTPAAAAAGRDEADRPQVICSALAGRIGADAVSPYFERIFANTRRARWFLAGCVGFILAASFLLSFAVLPGVVMLIGIRGTVGFLAARWRGDTRGLLDTATGLPLHKDADRALAHIREYVGPLTDPFGMEGGLRDSMPEDMAEAVLAGAGGKYEQIVIPLLDQLPIHHLRSWEEGRARLRDRLDEQGQQLFDALQPDWAGNLQELYDTVVAVSQREVTTN